ncbi:MAG TPA: endolytic transglycosylase MltG [Polyangiales bacterium]
MAEGPAGRDPRPADANVDGVGSAPPPALRSHKRLIVLGVLGWLALCGLCGLGWLVIVYPDSRPAATGRVTAVELGEQPSLQAVAADLGRARLIAQPGVFALYARVLGAGPRLRHGRVLVTDAMNVRELLQRIAVGYGATELRITIPEGFSRYDVAARLAEWGVCAQDEFARVSAQPDQLAQLDPKAPSTEGYLFPDTYRVRDDTRPQQLVRRMVDNARKRMARLQGDEASALGKLRDEFGFGLHEVVTLASIVEKEAHEASEQPVIAGVFLNRLRDPTFKPKRLQADPTVAYGCRLAPALPSCLGFDGKRITRVMTADPDNAYNTYRRDGLPPGPIANPGLSALRAVLHPAVHNYFYFVARGDGHHEFSATLQAHNAAVQHVGER